MLAAVVPAHGQAAAPAFDREALIAALERLMTTGEPRHIDHDDGELLHAAVGEAIRHGDAEIARLAVAGRGTGVRVHGGCSPRQPRVLATILAQPPESWPSGDIAVAPRTWSCRAVAKVSTSPTIRNFGGATLHNAHVFVATVTGSGRNSRQIGRRSFVIDVPPGGRTTPDPTPEDAIAFRVVNPRAAPRNYVR